jgi:hypothetical protein
MEVEIPNNRTSPLTSEVAKFEKFFNGKALAIEIDKLHGIEPALCRWTDAKLSGLRKSIGMTASDTQSILSLI